MSKFSLQAKGVASDDAAIDYPYEMIICDTDTQVFRAAKLVQEDYVIVMHRPSKKTMEFPNKTAFWGHWKTKSGGWLKEQNDKREEEGKKPFPVEDFEIEECVRLLDDPEIKDHIEEGVKNFDFFIGSLKKLNLAPTYKLCIGGQGNYRYDIAESLPYKGDRPEKPILFTEIREAIINKYKNRVEIVDGKEADDQLAVYGKENYLHYKKTGKWKYVLGYIDKDLQMIVSPAINLDKMEEGVHINDVTEAFKKYGVQLLIGDKQTDNIPGLPNLVNEVREKYEIRKGEVSREGYRD